MVKKEDFERILPDQVIKNLAERKLLLIVGIVGISAFIIIVVLAALLGHCGTGGFQGPKDECRTPPCIHSAAWIADNMDTSVNPCENFYKYACGGWERRNSIPPDQSEITVVEQLEEEIDEKLREIIEKIPQASNSYSLGAAEEKLQIFFRSCVHDYGRMKAAGYTLVNQIKTSLKGWYAIDPNNWSSQFNVNDAIGATQSDLMTYVFFTTHLSWDNSLNRYVLGVSFRVNSNNNVSPTARWVSQTSYNNPNNPAENAYKEYIRALGGMLLDDSNITITSQEKATRIEQYATDVYRMEKDLSLMLDRTRRNGSYSLRRTMTLGQLQATYPQIGWSSILTRMFDGMGISESTLIRVSAPMFFRQFNDLIQNETRMNERDRIFNNYLVWKIASKYANDLSWEYREASYRYQETLSGRREWPPVWKTCLATVYNRLGTLLAYEFIKNHISLERKNEVSRIYTDIRQAVADRLIQLDWIDQETKIKAIEKLNSVTPKVGFADIYYNETLMTQLHSTLDIKRTSTYFENLMSLNKFQRKMRTEFFLKTHQNTIQNIVMHQPLLGGMISYWVTPYLSRYYSTLIIPAGAMLEPLYNADRSKVVNYGVLGTLVATELLGAVDETGRYSLKNGSSGDWWTNATSQAYETTTECFKKYFDDLEAGPFLVNGQNYTVKVDGEGQVYRLMDDLGGIRAAYYGYKKWMKDTGSKDPVPAGLDLTRDQLFFVSSVQTKCYLRTDESSYSYAMWHYIPEDMEVNSLLSHMSEFSNAFSCPKGSKMRQAYQCETY